MSQALQCWPIAPHVWVEFIEQWSLYAHQAEMLCVIFPLFSVRLPGTPTVVFNHGCLLYCFVLSPLTLLGAVPHHHLTLSVKELTYSSN